MKYHVTQSQFDNIKDKLQVMVKTIGVKPTAKMVGGSFNLSRLAFKSGPIEFLNLFNDMEVVKSTEIPQWTLFRYKKGNNLIVYNRKTRKVLFDDDIWDYLFTAYFLYSHRDIRLLTKDWVMETYGLKRISTDYISAIYMPSEPLKRLT